MKIRLRNIALGSKHIGAIMLATMAAAGLIAGIGQARAQITAAAGASPLDQALAGYDAVITADTLASVGRLDSAITLDGSAAVEFDFGQTSGDATLEFILEGDPAANESAYLAVGENTGSNLRYELWNNTGQLGFTQLGVADYQFSPGVPSPTQPTHVAYVWSADTLTMRVFVNGALAGTAANINENFAMPTGFGWLGANPTGGEPMVGTIHRVTVYDEVLSDDAIQRHARGFTDVLRPPIVASFTVSTNAIVSGQSATLQWAVQNASAVFVNGTDRTGVTNLTVSPLASTTYTLVASNNFGTATGTLRLSVSPPLGAYDAAISADVAGGLTPAARATNVVVLTGAAGQEFDFGATSGDVTMEFILEGDISHNVSAFLAVGETPGSSLRYELWNNTGHLGFTQAGVADYEFDPLVPSPSWPTHVTYVWDSAAFTMKIYINGVLAGTRTEVSDIFVMPSGPGWLGSTPSGAETMRGTIYRVTVYQGILPDAAILRHGDAFMAEARPALHAYDLAVRGGTAPAARVLAPVTLAGTQGVAFNFGEASGDATIEFILEGDPAAAISANLAVGEAEASRLRYEVWDNTGQLGFTQIAVADYVFTPGVPSPTEATHVAFRWNGTAGTMQAFVNGTLAGAVTEVDSNFVMPSGAGWLGVNPDGSEPMAGTIHRVTVYAELLPEDVILSHARTLSPPVGDAPSLSVNLTATTPSIVLEGRTGAHYRVEYVDALAPGQTWQLLQDVPSLSGTSITVTDPAPWAGRAQRFYRAVEVQ